MYAAWSGRVGAGLVFRGFFGDVRLGGRGGDIRVFAGFLRFFSPYLPPFFLLQRFVLRS